MFDTENNTTAQISEGSGSAPAAAGGASVESSSAPASQTDSTASVNTSESSSTAADTSPAGTDDSRTQPQTPPDQPMSAEEWQAFEQQVDQAVQDPASPEFFRNAIKQYKRHVGEAVSRADAFKPLDEFGGIEQIQADIELARALQTRQRDPRTGFPVRSTTPFIEKLDEQTAMQLFQDLSQRPSPLTNGYTLVHEVMKAAGIPPERIGEIQNYLKNGYQSGSYPRPSDEELQGIPEHLRNTYADLSPEHREEIRYMENENVRNDMLESAKFKMEQDRRQQLSEREQEQQRQQEQFQQEQQLAQQVFEAGNKNFEEACKPLFTSFVDSLLSQAGMTKLDSMMVANMVINTFEDTFAGRQSLEALNAEGIEVDPRIGPQIQALNDISHNIEYYTLIKDEANKNALVKEQVELQERLTAYGNKLVASLASKRSANTAAAAAQANNLLDNAQLTRPAVHGQPTAIGMGNGSMRNVTYDRLLAQDPHFNRQG